MTNDRGVRSDGSTPPLPDGAARSVLISTIVLAGQPSPRLARCLASLAWSAQVIVMVTDRASPEAARALAAGCDVVVMPWTNFADVRNHVAAHAVYEWLFHVDADEEVSQGLCDEIARAIVRGAVCAYAMPRRNVLLHHRMRHGGWWPDWQVRLFRRGTGAYVGPVHERFVATIPTPMIYLRHPLLHDSHLSLSDVIRRIDRYTDLEVQPLSGWERVCFPLVVIARPCAHFVRRYLWQSGFRDGVPGLLEASLQAFYIFCRYAKRWEAMHGNPPECGTLFDE